MHGAKIELKHYSHIQFTFCNSNGKQIDIRGLYNSLSFSHFTDMKLDYEELELSIIASTKSYAMSQMRSSTVSAPNTTASESPEDGETSSCYVRNKVN